MEVACTAKRNFDRECKKTFATKSARSGCEQPQQNSRVIRSPHRDGRTGLEVDDQLTFRPVLALNDPRSPRMPKPQHPLSSVSYCHMSFDWCSEAIPNAVGGKCISYLGGNLSLCPLIQASNCRCNRGC